MQQKSFSRDMALKIIFKIKKKRYCNGIQFNFVPLIFNNEVSNLE
jgi:hypothetical protein